MVTWQAWPGLVSREVVASFPWLPNANPNLERDLSINKSPDKRPVNSRGREWQAIKLTGNRAQKGVLSGGGPKFVYEDRSCGRVIANCANTCVTGQAPSGSPVRRTRLTLRYLAIVLAYCC